MLDLRCELLLERLAELVNAIDLEAVDGERVNFESAIVEDAEACILDMILDLLE